MTAPYPVLLYEAEKGRVLFRDDNWNARELPCDRERLPSVSSSIRELYKDVQAQSKLIREETNFAILSNTDMVIDVRDIERKQLELGNTYTIP